MRSEISKMMRTICCTCIIQGPMTGADEYGLEECIGTSPTRWLCRKCCSSEDRQHILRQTVENVDRLSNLMQDSAIQAVKVQDSSDQSIRIVFMPKCFEQNRAIELGKQFYRDVTCEEAIAEIVKKVISEGLHCTLESIDKEMVKILDSQIGEADLRQI